MTMPELSLGESTRRALAAAYAGDLEDLGHALRDREAAMATAPPGEQAAALADGAILGLRLTEIKLNLAVEHGRLEQVREGFANYRGSCSRASSPASSRAWPSFDVRG